MYVTFLDENFLSHSTKKLLVGILSCFRNFLYRTFFWIRSVGGITILRQKCFVPQYQKTSCGNPFLFPNFYVSKLFLDKKCGGYHNFPSELFCGTVVKKVRRGILQCFINFGYRKTLCIKLVYQDFLWQYFCLT